MKPSGSETRLRQVKPFYLDCVCTKVKGGKKPLWRARLILVKGVSYEDTKKTGVGNTADNAIKDLQTQINTTKKPQNGSSSDDIRVAVAFGKNWSGRPEGP